MVWQILVANQSSLTIWVGHVFWGRRGVVVVGFISTKGKSIRTYLGSGDSLNYSKRTPAQIVSSLSAAAATAALLPSGANALILPFSNLDSPPSRASSRLPAGSCATCAERGWRPGRIGRTWSSAVLEAPVAAASGCFASAPCRRRRWQIRAPYRRPPKKPHARRPGPRARQALDLMPRRSHGIQSLYEG